MNSRTFPTALILVILQFFTMDSGASTLVTVLATAWNHAGTQLAVVGVRSQDALGYVAVVDGQTYEINFESMPPSSGFTSVSWSPDDRRIALSSFDSTIWIIDVDTGLEVAQLHGHQSTVADVDWSPDGQTLISVGNWDKSVILWDANTYQIIRLLTLAGDGMRGTFSPDGLMFAVAQNVLSVFPASLDVGGLRDQVAYTMSRETGYAIAWSHDGQKIAIGGPVYDNPDGTRPDAHIYVVDTGSRSQIGHFLAPWGTVSGLAWSPSDDLLASYSIDDILAVWDVSSNVLISTYGHKRPSPHFIGTPDFSRYGGRLAYVWRSIQRRNRPK